MTPSESQPRQLKILLLHGFAGSPGELRPLGQALVGQGFTVLAPLLPGHGESFEAMEQCRLEDWTDALDRCYHHLHRDNSPVAVVGFCLGGTLALHRTPSWNPKAVACLAAPVDPFPEEHFPLLTPNSKVRSALPILQDARSKEAKRWRNMAGHKTIPTATLEEVQRAIRETRAGLSEVRCSLFVAQSRADRVVHPINAELMINEVGSVKCKLAWSRRSGHALPLDIGRRALFRELSKFLVEEDQDYQSRLKGFDRT